MNAVDIVVLLVLAGAVALVIRRNLRKGVPCEGGVECSACRACAKGGCAFCPGHRDGSCPACRKPSARGPTDGSDRREGTKADIPS